MTRSTANLYRSAGQGMLRAVVNRAAPHMSPWPATDAPPDHWRAWLTVVWADDIFRQAVADASPDLHNQVQSIVQGRTPKPRRMRRAALATARYALRYMYRSTPFGLFAGVAPIKFSDDIDVRIGDCHRVVTRPNPIALDEAITSWEADGKHMADVDLCLNNLAHKKSGRVYVPSEGASEFSLALTPALELVLRAARSPIRFSVLVGKLAAEFPTTTEDQRIALLTQLLRVRLLLSSLRAPATVVDPTSPLPAVLKQQTQNGPATSDVRLEDAVKLPKAVITEAEKAATVLTRICAHPSGTPAWQRYTERFSDRYGSGSHVPLEQLIDPDQGLGLPEGFGQMAEPPRPMTLRDRLLLELAGTATLEGRRSVNLSAPMIERLEAAAGTPALTPPHLEVCAHVRACSTHALKTGNFRLGVSYISRALGTMTGRFWHLDPTAQNNYEQLPTVEPDAELVQLSFHPARVRADLLTRAPQVLPRLISVGEFRHRIDGVLFPDDLAVGIENGRLHLCEVITGRRLEVLAPTAINFVWNNYTPPLVRFLAEISRAHAPQVTGFDWGAAWTLPFTPAVHHRRSILVPARWKLHARDLPGRRVPRREWAQQLHAWRDRFGAPQQVLLTEDDQQLPLDLGHDMHLDVLRAHLDARPAGVAILHEAPPRQADGWFGRAHSIIVPLEVRP